MTIRSKAPTPTALIETLQLLDRNGMIEAASTEGKQITFTLKDDFDAARPDLFDLYGGDENR